MKYQNIYYLLFMLLVFYSCRNNQVKEESYTEDTLQLNDSEITTEPVNKSRIDVVDFGIDKRYPIPKGLKKGDRAPDFKFSDNGKTQSLYSILKQKPVVLVFYRGYWCSYCNRYLSKLQDSLQLIQQQGAQVLAITPEPPALVDTMRTTSGASFTIVSDTTNKIIDDYQVNFYVTKAYSKKIMKTKGVDLSAPYGGDEAHLPVPATFVIGVDQLIDYVHFNPNYKKRPNIKKLLEDIPDV